MKKYPSIEQFRNIIRKVKERHDYVGRDENDEPIYKHDSDYPILRFKGTVKVHGTNSAIVKYTESDELQYQSRNNIITKENDNAGFVNYISQYESELNSIFNNIEENYSEIYNEPIDSIVIYGEWAGGNIQKGVAINQVPKFFIIFEIMVNGVTFDYSLIINQYNNQRIFDIRQVDQFFIDIDFNKPELSQQQLIDWTIKVEDECPVGKLMGVSGIGEGIVFTCMSQPDLKFKSKGEKHSVSKVKVLNPIDTEILESMHEFVEYAVTESRLQQGIDYLKEQNIPISMKSTGDFLRWIVNDIQKEESDTIEENGFIEKKLNPLISIKAKTWYFNNIE